jgi:predicted DNA-binding transcriptional regulator AlpA
MRYLTRQQVAHLLGVSEQTLANWAWQGKGPPCVRFSRRCVRYSQEALESWIRDCQPAPAEVAALLKSLAQGNRPTPH